MIVKKKSGKMLRRLEVRAALIISKILVFIVVGILETLAAVVRATCKKRSSTALLVKADVNVVAEPACIDAVAKTSMRRFIEVGCKLCGGLQVGKPCRGNPCGRFCGYSPVVGIVCCECVSLADIQFR